MRIEGSAFAGRYGTMRVVRLIILIFIWVLGLLSLLNAWPLDSGISAVHLLGAVYLPLGVLFSARELMDRKTFVDIDAERGEVSKHRISWFGTEKIWHHELSEFDTVISFVTFSSFPRHVVKLSGNAGRNQMIVGLYEPVTCQQGGIHGWSEPQGARELRTRVVELTGLKDGGFIGLYPALNSVVSFRRNVGPKGFRH